MPEDIKFTLPEIKMDDVQLSSWLDTGACCERRAGLIRAILFEMALERADFNRINIRHSDKQSLIETKKENFKIKGIVHDSEEWKVIFDMELEQLDDEQSMEASQEFMQHLENSAEAMFAAMPSDGPDEPEVEEQALTQPQVPSHNGDE